MKVKWFIVLVFDLLLVFACALSFCTSKKKDKMPTVEQTPSDWATKLREIKCTAKINGKFLELVPADDRHKTHNRFIPSARAFNLEFNLFPIVQNEKTTLQIIIYLLKDIRSQEIQQSFIVSHLFYQVGSDVIKVLHSRAKPNDFKITPIYFLQPDSTFSYRFSGVLSPVGYMGMEKLEHYKLPEKLLIEDGYLEFKL